MSHGTHRQPGPGGRPGVLTVHPLGAIPEVVAGADLGVLLRDALAQAGLDLQEGDVLAVSSKILSKAWGLRLDGGAEGAADGDARQDAVLAHSTAVVAERRTPTGTTRIVRAVAGPVMTGAGIDGSNTGADARLLALPDDPDLAAREVYARLLTAYAPAALPRIGIVLTDTAGRPWRQGQTDFALGACGLTVLEDLRHTADADGRELSVTARAVADEIAAAADLVKGKASGVPAAVLRGLPEGTVAGPGAAGARSLVRTGPGDWFALGSTEAVRSALGVPPGSAAAQEVGIASAAPEEESLRVARAVRLALHGEGTATVTEEGAPRPPRAGTHPAGRQLVVTATDPFVAGRVCARLEAALASEGIDGLAVSWSDPAD